MIREKMTNLRLLEKYFVKKALWKRFSHCKTIMSLIFENISWK